MASPDSADLSAATLHLYRITGVVGLLLMKSGNQLANHMPFADVRTNELGAHVTQMAAGYEQVKRRVRQVLMAFDSGTLLIVLKEQIQLALMLTPQADLDKASLAAGAFLTDYAAQLDAAAPTAKLEKANEPEKPRPAVKPESGPVAIPMAFAANESVREKALMAEPEFDVWSKVNAILETILGKVMGSAQATRLINRMSEARHGKDVSGITPAEARSLARAVLEQVPNRAKRDALLSEFDHALTEAKI
jgi:hypothetical protein